MGRIDRLHPAVIVQNHHMGGKAVSHMALGEGHIRPQLIRGLEKFRVKLPALQGIQASPGLVQGFPQIHGRQPHRLPGNQGLAGAGGCSGIRGKLRVGAHIFNLLPLKAQSLGRNLHKHSGAALPNVRGSAVELHHAVIYNQLGPALIRKPHADPRILHGTGNARPARVGLIDLLHRQKRLLQGCGAIRNLPVGQHLARLNGIAVADFPGRKPCLLRQEIDGALQGKLALAHPEASEGPRRRIIRIISVSPDIRILVAVGSHGMGAGPLQNRPAQGRVGPGVKVNLAVQARENSILVAAQGKGALHIVPLGMEIDGLLPGKCHLHRPVHLEGCQSRDVLGRHILLAAKAAAYQLIFHHHPLLLPAQHDGDFLARVVNPLVRGIHLHSIFVGEGHSSLRLQKGVLREWRLIVLGHHVLGLCQRLPRVPTGHVAVLAQVAVFMELGGVLRHSLPHGAHRRKNLVLYPHKGLCFL